MTLANYITFLRLAMSPLVLTLYLGHRALGIEGVLFPELLIGLLTISELSDALDGYLARRYNQVTELGKILDPMADSLSRTSLFLAFTQPPVELPMGLAFIFLYRDSAISTLRMICALRGLALAARPSGKIKAFIQAAAAFAVLGLLLLKEKEWITLSTLQWGAAWIVGGAAVYTLYSGIEYLRANRHYISRLLLPNRGGETQTTPSKTVS